MQIHRQERRTDLARTFRDDRAFRAWYDAAVPRVYGYLFNRTGRDPDLADELTQQAFVSAVRSVAAYDGGDDISWLIGIARNVMLEHFRRQERRERGLLRLVTGPQRVAWIGPPDSDDELARGLAKLPAAQRAALVLRYVDDLSVREVARRLGRSEGAVESLLSRGREALRRSAKGSDR